MSIFVELPPARYCATAFAAFDPAAGFSVGNARALMWFSQLAYETGKQATIDLIAPGWGFAKVAVFVQRKIAANAVCATCGLIGERPDAVVLAFSGTDPVVWQMHATNLNIRLSQDCDTHSGFKAAMEAAQGEIERAVELCRGGGKPLFVAGHSLGAALAVLAAQQADRLGGTPRGVYVYGMPRVGGARFRDDYNARLGDITYRLVHGDDIVACVPFSGIGFRHVGRMLACTSGEKFAASAPLSDHGCDAPQLADPHRRFVNGIRGLFAGEAALPQPGGLQGLARAFPKPFRDHLQDRYFGALAE